MIITCASSQWHTREQPHAAHFSAQFVCCVGRTLLTKRRWKRARVALERSASRSPLISKIVRRGAVPSHSAVGIDFAAYAKLSGKWKVPRRPAAQTPHAGWRNSIIWYGRLQLLFSWDAFSVPAELNSNTHTHSANSFFSDTAPGPDYPFHFSRTGFILTQYVLWFWSDSTPNIEY